MQNLTNIVNKAIIKTLKNHGLFYDAKGKIKFNHAKFNANLNDIINRKHYPAHSLNVIIDDALMNMKNLNEYQIALEYLNNMEQIHLNRNNRKIAFCSNVSNYF